ncbi:MAG: DNA polymerase III subunit delta [Firmicutes bacterium]|nr:DNA polymerase III subunit delta [Bacillota bacterium]
MDARPVTIIISEDTKAAADKAFEIRQGLLTEESDWNHSEHDGQEAEVDVILGDLLTPPFMGGTKVVTVKRVDGLAADDLVKLGETLGELPRGVYFLATAVKIDKRGRFYRKIKELGEFIELDQISAAQRLGWVKKTAAELGLVELSDSAAQMLIERSGGSFTWIQGELGKLASYCGSLDRPISSQELESLISAGWSEVDSTASFQLLDQIAAGNTKGALELLHRLLESGQPALALFGTLAWQYRMVVAAASLFQAGMSTGQVPRRITQTMGMKSYPAEKASQVAARLGVKNAYRAFNKIFTANYHSRLGVHSPEVALELLVIELSHLCAAQG